MFINNIDPVFLKIGIFEIRYYGLIYAIGFLFAYFWLRHEIKNKNLKISFDDLDKYFLWLMLGIILGARIFEILFFSPKYYFNNISEIFMIWNGGLSFHGGLVGAIIVTLIFCKKHNIKFYDLADSLVIPGALALAIGRIANFINSEHFGRITNPANTSWCVKFIRVDEYCRHPSQIYESLKNFIIFGVLIYKRNKNKLLVKGELFWMFVLLYGILRFLTNFYRDDELFFGLSVGQYLSLIMVGVAIFFLNHIKKPFKHKTKN